MKIDIITGFLGAGKTTFISNYVKYLQAQNQKVIIIENELGMAGIDGGILKGEDIEVTEISGGCVCCTQKAKLVVNIEQAYERGYDRVVFEPSGIYNLDTFFDLMNDPDLDGKCEIGSIITIAKPNVMEYSQGVYKNILMSQFLSAGAIVFSNTQSCTIDEISQTILDIYSFCKNFSSEFEIDQMPLYTKDWADFTDEDYSKLSNVGRTHFEHKSIYENHSHIIGHVFLGAKLSTYENINALIEYLFSLKNSEVFRVKGYVQIANKEIYVVNCTPNCVSIKPSKSKHAVINIIGTKLNQAEIQEKIKELN